MPPPTAPSSTKWRIPHRHEPPSVFSENSEYSEHSGNSEGRFSVISLISTLFPTYLIMSKQDPYIITIGRSFGSGGRVLGKKLAETFGIDYYDKRLLSEAAKQAGMDTSFFERADEKFPTFLSGGMHFNMGFSPMPWYSESSISDDAIYRAQSDVIKAIADRGPCVIVGRSADYVLRDHPSACVNIFVSAPMEDCVKRIMERGDCLTEQAARQAAEKTNKLRANYYNFYTEKRWGDAQSYDLCLNSSLLSMEAAVELIAQYIRLRFGIEPVRKADTDDNKAPQEQKEQKEQ